MKLCDYGCGKEARYQFKNGKWCCSESYKSCSGIKEKRKQTNLEKYGVEHNFRIKGFIEKRNQACLEKYGVEHPLQNKEVQEKKKQTCLKNYGVDNPSKNKEIIEKKKQTNLKIRGVEYSWQSKEVQEKIKQANLKTHGVEYPSQSKEVQEKVKQTCFERYGTKHYRQSVESKEKFLERHPFFRQVEEIKIEDNQFKVHCKNRNCMNSKEQGGWFTPASLQVNNRITALETADGSDGSFFYCSENCKTTCDAFNIHGDPERDTQLPYTPGQLQTFRLEVLTRDNYICQYCGKPATIVHHEKPVKLYPESALDPDYAWSCCGGCHYAKGHPQGTSCSTGNLAAVVCRPVKKKEKI